jgi:hypothetical protein
LTPIGTGEAGYKKLEIASLLHDIAGNEGYGTKGYKLKGKKRWPLPNNVVMTKEWFTL